MSVALPLATATVQNFNPDPNLGSGQASGVTNVATSYCQFQDDCSPEIEVEAVTQNEIKPSYCQFHSDCSVAES